MPIPTKVAERLTAGLKKFKSILENAKSRDINESDTGVIVVDLLHEVFGFDKFNEITSELCIKGTYCDLAIRLEDKIRMIIEVKQVSSDLKDPYVKQAVDYAANKGIEWVALTNGHQWQVFRVLFKQPIDHELALDIDLPTINMKETTAMENLYLLTKESILKTGLDDYWERHQVLNRFMIAAALVSEPGLEVVRKILKKVTADVKIQVEDLTDLMGQVLKREVIEGDKFEQAQRIIQKATRKTSKTPKEKEEPIKPVSPVSGSGEQTTTE